MLLQFHAKHKSLFIMCQPALLNRAFALNPLKFHPEKLQSLNLCKIPFDCLNFSSGIYLKGYRSITTRSFSSSCSGSGFRSQEKNLPWLARDKAKRAKGSDGVVAMKASPSSWEESAEKFLKSGGSVSENVVKRFGNRGDEEADGDYGREEVKEDEESEQFDDPRWDRIKNRFNRIKPMKGSDRPEVKRWNNQESWGRKTWKEATESTVPKMVGEGVYGVGPVLAALSAQRREFYALYVQEGLDLSGSNRKKKDKKGVEKALRISEKIGLCTKEVSKHDLNMIADNRPHQGLILDASPLEMVNIRELEPVSCEEGEGAPLWVALDEVTDPQNLGAIIRSSYFFGASGVVLCAKNSAPLSGTVSKASAGSLELTEVRSCKNMMQFLASSAGNGWRVLGGSVSSKALPLDKVERGGTPTILVLGSEGMGLRPLVERSCTQLVRIPGNVPVDVTAKEEDDDVDADGEGSSGNFKRFMAVESLNVSVAAGVLLHYLIRRSCAADK